MPLGIKKKPPRLLSLYDIKTEIAIAKFELYGLKPRKPGGRQNHGQ